jgi:hypothetical protein
MLTDSQIEILCTKMQIPLAGIFFKNELPRKLEYNKGYVINIQDSHDGNGLENSGSHWTCFYVAKYPNGNVEPIYFDSYGMPPPKQVEKFMKWLTIQDSKMELEYSARRLQYKNTECGVYSVYFIIRMLSGDDFAEFSRRKPSDSDMLRLRKCLFST